jgi:hypothetical protein
MIEAGLHESSDAVLHCGHIELPIAICSRNSISNTGRLPAAPSARTPDINEGGMRYLTRFCRDSPFSLPLIGVVSILLVAPCRAGSIGVLVPSYFYPGSGGTGNGWSAMAAAASQIPVTAILNPDSGPVSGPVDPNYVSAMTNLENAGGKVIAYVYTNNGGTPLATVESEVSTYINQYGNLINGFFLDGMNVLPSTLSYYQSLDTYLKALQSSHAVFANPGQPFLNGVSPSDYLTTADVLDIFEGPDTAPAGSAGFNNYPYGLNWFENQPRDRFANIIYDVPSSAAMQADIARANQLNAGYLYITDQGGDNPYAQLPSYWNQEVSPSSQPHRNRALYRF